MFHTLKNEHVKLQNYVRVGLNVDQST